jgi:hypothetical protein
MKRSENPNLPLKQLSVMITPVQTVKQDFDHVITVFCAEVFHATPCPYDAFLRMSVIVSYKSDVQSFKKAKICNFRSLKENANRQK